MSVAIPTSRSSHRHQRTLSHRLPGAVCAQRSGHIVNVASVAGLLPIPDLAVYVATKHAVVGFSASLRAEAGRFSARVTTVCPGRSARISMDPW